MSGDISQLLLGICAGALFAMAAAMLRAARPAPRWTGFAFFLCSAVFAIKLWNDQTQVLGPEVRVMVAIFSMMSVGWFWLMVMALFGDIDRYRPVMFLAPVAMAGCGFANLLHFEGLAPYVWAVTTLAQAAFAVMSIMIVIRSWKDDLVESRRRMRGPFMVAVGFYILSLNGFDIAEMLGQSPAWYPMFNAGLLAAITVLGAFVFLDPREAMVGAEPQVAAPAAPSLHADARANGNGHALSGYGNGGHGSGGNGHNGNGKTNGVIAPVMAANQLDRAAKADLERLQALMTTQQVWREEGLTIASLAVKAGMPEAQLRRLISDCLGYRNFPSFVNAHRIGAAKSRLADPNEARVTVSTIAYDIGFASLGPFNRAFKEETGVSPSEWRRKSLNEPSPISEEA
jgi:AraC-like DNA-binding protein